MKGICTPVPPCTEFYKHSAIISSSGGFSSICVLSSSAQGEVKVDEQDLQQAPGVSGLGGPNRSVEQFVLTCLSSSRELGLEVDGPWERGKGMYMNVVTL